MNPLCWIMIVCVGFQLNTCVQGHGKMEDPVNRASLWRVDKSAPIDYDDVSMFCGGKDVQHRTYGGKCGICGDSYGDPTPRAHENGGKYGTGKIVKRYRRGSTIPVSVRLTQNHRGFFTFSLCKLSHSKERETERCFKNLKIADGKPTYKLPNTNNGVFDVKVKLPKDVTCNHCVLRWTYTAGNDWGYCPDGRGALGCGPQETFRSCSDIAID